MSFKLIPHHKKQKLKQKYDTFSQKNISCEEIGYFFDIELLWIEIYFWMEIIKYKYYISINGW